MGESKLTTIVREFERAWIAHLQDGGERPDIASAIGSLALNRQAALLSLLLPVELDGLAPTQHRVEMEKLLLRIPSHESSIRKAFSNFADSQGTLAPGKMPSKFAKKKTPKLEDETIGHGSSSNADSTMGKSTPVAGHRFGDFEIIEEIARGGMGVVFRARDTNLDRDCALKMILSGQFASELEVQRFYAEAQAAAKLEHPGIVPIYEIGSLEGHHFFAMKFVDGGSLADQLDSLRSEPQRAVELIESVARAVHFAHERGILHRDLKPANILMDSDGTPLVSDLGLAKNTRTDCAMTRTGAIVGTPAYMSCEQASGSPDITTAADIYSLGAMLYEMMTGCVPHAGSTPMETILKVLNEQPASLRSLNPNVDRNIELICNKCLEKDPKQRYSSAEALANDLRNWLDGKPISLKPPNPATVFSDWLKYNMRSVVGAGLIGLIFGLLLGATVWITIADDNVPELLKVYEGFPSESPPRLAIETGVGKWFADNPTLTIIPIIFFVGLTTTLVTRPDSRRSSITLGTLAGLVMSMTAFATGIGWGPLMQKTMIEHRQDVELLGEAASEDAATSKKAKRQLLRKYPDLKSLPIGLRSSYVANKTFVDGVMGIPIGLWMGMVASLICCLVPAILGTVFSSHLLKQKQTARRIFLPYLEVAILISMACVFAVMVFAARRMGANLTVPPMLWQVALFGSLFLASWVALKGFDWRFRVLVHALWMIALLFYQFEVSRIDQTPQVASQLLANGKYDEATTRFERYLDNQPDHVFYRYHAAVVYAFRGNRQLYDRQRSEMMSRHSRSLVPSTAEQTAKVWFLLPDDSRRASYKEVLAAVDLADYAIAEGQSSRYLPYFLMTRGLGAYRLGQFENVAHWTDQSSESRMPFVSETSSMIAAMAAVRMDDNQKSRIALAGVIESAQRAIEKFMSVGSTANSVANPLTQFLIDQLFLKVLVKEAEALLASE